MRQSGPGASPTLSLFTENGQTSTPGWPTCGDGWRELVEAAVGRIATASAELLLVRIPAKVDGLCRESDALKKAATGGATRPIDNQRA